MDNNSNDLISRKVLLEKIECMVNKCECYKKEYENYRDYGAAMMAIVRISFLNDIMEVINNIPACDKEAHNE